MLCVCFYYFPDELLGFLAVYMSVFPTNGSSLRVEFMPYSLTHFCISCVSTVFHIQWTLSIYFFVFDFSKLCLLSVHRMTLTHSCSPVWSFVTYDWAREACPLTSALGSKHVRCTASFCKWHCPCPPFSRLKSSVDPSLALKKSPDATIPMHVQPVLSFLPEPSNKT